MTANRKKALRCALMLVVPGLLQAGEFPVADIVIVDKSARELYLMKGGEPFRTFKIALGGNPEGDKTQEGDFKTPEGEYLLDTRNPDSDYFLSIHVSYPSVADRRAAKKRGLNPGGAIMIHGQPNEQTESEAYYRSQDLTNGCITVTNVDMIDNGWMRDADTPNVIIP